MSSQHGCSVIESFLAFPQPPFTLSEVTLGLCMRQWCWLQAEKTFGLLGVVILLGSSMTLGCLTRSCSSWICHLELRQAAASSPNRVAISATHRREVCRGGLRRAHLFSANETITPARACPEPFLAVRRLGD
jgi:hypothetical protein